MAYEAICLRYGMCSSAFDVLYMWKYVLGWVYGVVSLRYGNIVVCLDRDNLFFIFMHIYTYTLQCVYVVLMKLRWSRRPWGYQLDTNYHTCLDTGHMFDIGYSVFQLLCVVIYFRYAICGGGFEVWYMGYWTMSLNNIVCSTMFQVWYTHLCVLIMLYVVVNVSGIIYVVVWLR